LLRLEPGDLLVLYSDGVTDAGVDRGEPFGESRLEALVAGHREEDLARIQQEVLAAVRAWSQGEAEDDMTLLLVRAREIGGEAT
jgi:sigma-B regulation protein RsbU (phosphoserine phosphatase)